MFFWYFYGLLLDHWFEPRFRLPMSRFNWVSPNSNLTDSISVLLWPFWCILSSLLMFLWCFDSLIFDHWFEIIVFSSIRFNSLFHLWLFPLRIICTFFDVLANVSGLLWCFLVNKFWSVIWNQHCFLLITRFNWIPICFPVSAFVSLWFWPLADLGQFFGLTCEWCFLVTTCWSLIWNSLLMVDDSFQLDSYFLPNFHVGVIVVVTFGRSWPVFWVVFVMFPSHYLLVTDLKFLADCQWLVSAFFSSIFLRQHWLHFWPGSCYSFWPIRFDHPSVSFCP